PRLTPNPLLRSMRGVGGLHLTGVIEVGGPPRALRWRAILWGSNTRSLRDPLSSWLSGGDLVLVRKPAEDWFPADPVLGEVDLKRPGLSLSRCDLAEGTVRPGCVVVHHVLTQHPAQVMLICNQQPVKELPAQGTDHPFADRVRSGCLRRAGHNPDTFRHEHGIEGTGELACAIPDQELD